MYRTYGKAIFSIITICVIVFLLAPNITSLARTTGLSIYGHSFPIAADPDVGEWSSAVAFDDSRRNFLVVYEDGSEISAVCLNNLGEQLAYYALGSGIFPDIVYNIHKDQYLAVWVEISTDMEIVGAFISGNCTNEPGTITHIPSAISGDRAGDNFAPAVAYNHHENHQDYFVVWENIPPTGITQIFARRVTSEGIGLDSSFEIKSSTTAYHSDPDVAYNLNMNEYLVVYTHQETSPGATSDVYGRRVYNSGGMGVLPEEIIDSSGESQMAPAVAAYRLNQATPYLVVFRDYWNDTSGDVRGYMLNKEGEPQLLLNIATQSAEIESEPAIGMSEHFGGYIVAWLHQAALTSKLHFRQINNTGLLEPVELVAELPVVIGQPALADGPAIPLLTWTQHNPPFPDIYGQLIWVEQIYLPYMVR